MNNERKAYIVKADITKHEDVKNMYEYIRSKTDRLDILVNNAGANSMNYISYMKEEEWDKVIDTNLKGAFLCSKYASKLMIACNKGNIVNISSDSAITPGVRQVNYVASKSGLIAMTRSMAKELGIFGIRVNAVAPGLIKTDLNNMSKNEIERVKK
ncbi:SDR family oxidoreductase [Clostridium sp. MSJ-4]|uniref:SDR family oxidoreductase n=1 Tax=Clostridium simiarum TaxID=2841506 RepID=A0ABS6EXQ1_9CLOT|nr:SDR family NAD(P)-dependent oxidoreductase [Clostridium simiarum]MBU5591004.1 SDR family oxidoreductase [Clostridium simiarum]